MANMSYCRFVNTNSDLADCTKALESVAYDEESISQSEWYHAKAMKVWCERYLEIFEDIEDNEIEINIREY